jgi:hypothetical protein
MRTIASRCSVIAEPILFSALLARQRQFDIVIRFEVIDEVASSGLVVVESPVVISGIERE